MINLRPHTLSYQIIVSDGHYDDRGDWHEALIKYSQKVACRYEPNGKANTIAMPDGKAYTYSYVVYLDLPLSRDFQYGQTVRMFNEQGQQIAEKTIAGFHRAQLNARIWL